MARGVFWSIQEARICKNYTQTLIPTSKKKMVEDTSNLSFHQLLGNSLPDSQIGDPSVVSSIYCCISVLCVCLCVCVCVCSAMSNSLPLHGLQPTRLLRPWDSPGKNTGVGCHFLLQGIFPTQGSNLVSQIATIVLAVTLWVSYLD